MLHPKGRERALASLLESDEISSLSSKPGELVLPPVVHSNLLGALALTGEDARERKIVFRYRFGNWHAGRVHTGTAVKTLNDGRTTDASTGINLLIGRPHIHMHTHPFPSLEQSMESVEKRPHTQGWSTSKKQDLGRREFNVHRGSNMLPSGGDLDNIYSISFGSIGNIIASNGGIFFALRDDVRDTELLIHKEPEVVKQRIEAYRKLFQVAIKQGYSAFITQKIILTAAANILSHRYTSYFSDNPKNPNLVRVAELL